MLIIHRLTDTSSESDAARLLGSLACEEYPDIENSSDIVLQIIPNVQCYGQNPQDIDLLVLFADYRQEHKLYKSKNGPIIHSFCATVEVKNHSPESIRFDGATCSVIYNGDLHNVSIQSEKQKYSARNYIKQNTKSQWAPWITNLIWLVHAPRSYVPLIDNNILDADSKWTDFIEKIALLNNSNNHTTVVRAFTSRNSLTEVSSVFTKKITASKIDRRKLEEITKYVLDQKRQQYAAKLGEQLLIFRGRGGTGKTVQLIRIAYQTYIESGLRVLLLTYNKALVADLTRLFTLLGVKDALGEKSIRVKTIHSFIREWLLALGVCTQDVSDFLLKYDKYKDEALDMLLAGALSQSDIELARAQWSRQLAWDLVLIDESQDWPANERDLLYTLYGHKKIVLADGVDQLVRSTYRINWREGLRSDEVQTVPLFKGLRLKSGLCRAVKHIARQLELNDWNIVPENISYGGKIIIIEGNVHSREFAQHLAEMAKQDGNQPIDILICVPPTWVKKKGERKESLIAEKYREWGFDVWDGVDDEERSTFPTSNDQFRIVQYESCRGLEGWVVIAYGLDEFFEHKRAYAPISDEQRQELFFDEESASLDYAKRWLMIPITRAIDTLVLHLTNRNSFVGTILQELTEKCPEEVEWIMFE